MTNRLIFLFYCTKIPLSSLTLHNTPLLTLAVKLIFSILLQHHNSKHLRNIWSTFRNVQFSKTYESVFQTEPYTTFWLKFKPNLLVKITPFLSFAKQGITLFSISTCSIENIYSNGSNTYYGKPYTGRCIVFYIVLIFHCWYLYVFHTYIHEYSKWYCWELVVGTICYLSCIIRGAADK